MSRNIHRNRHEAASPLRCPAARIQCSLEQYTGLISMVYQRLALAQHEIWLLIRLARVSCQGEWHRRMQQCRSVLKGSYGNTNWAPPKEPTQSRPTRRKEPQPLCRTPSKASYVQIATLDVQMYYIQYYIYSRYILDDGTSVIKKESCLVSALV